MTWSFRMGSSGDYGDGAVKVSVSKVVNNRITSTYSLNAIQAFDLTLSAGQNVGSASITLGNMDGTIFQNPAAQPHGMDIVHVRGTNRHGTWGPMWTGYIDTFHQYDDPTVGRQALLHATSPQKTFEIRTQLPGDVASLAISSIGGLAGSAILAYICSKTAVIYPGALKDLASVLGYEAGIAARLVVDPDADTGMANWQGLAQAVFLDPSQQSWEAVLEGLLADSGIQWFFNEMGALYWQKPKYISGKDEAPVVILTEDDIFSRDLSEGDVGVVTSVTVRYGVIELNAISVTRNTGELDAVAGKNPILAQFGTRIVVIYANWILDKGTAQNLANLLLQMYASNVLTATVIIVPDPTITIGCIVQVPTGRRTDAAGNPEQAIYYVAAIEYVLSWGSQYIMVLGLQYGRGIDTGWAYPGAQPYPQITIAKSDKLQTNIISFVQGSTTKIANIFQIIGKAGVPAGIALVDPSLIQPGTTFMLDSLPIAGFSSTPISSGNTGVYTAASGTKGQGYVIYITAPVGTSQGTITLVQGVAAAPVFTGDVGAGPGSGPAPGPAPVPNPPTPDPGDLTKFSNWPFREQFSFTQAFGPCGPGSAESAYYWPPLTPDATSAGVAQQITHFHTGVDLASAYQTPVYAVAPGVVADLMIPTDLSPGYDLWPSYRCHIESGTCVLGCNFLGFGNNAIVRRGDHLVHYGHLDSFNPQLKTGDKVQAGTLIGYQGNSTSTTAGTTDGSHLHLGVWDMIAEAWVAPETFFLAGGFHLGPDSLAADDGSDRITP